MKKCNILKFLIATLLLIGLSGTIVLPVQASLIEKTFSGDLEQIGYNFFQYFQTPGIGKYDNDYKLSIGEKLKIYCWGDSVNVMSLSGSELISPLIETQVDTKGELFIPGVGVVKAEGRSIAAVQKSIQKIADSKFKNVKIKITIADSSEFAIFVYGYVNRPGKIAVSSNSTVIEALAAAGGVNKNGSLRNITYRSGKKSTSIDLYDVIFNGKSSKINIKPNDSIFVNNIGGVAAVQNGVKIPGIYELSEGESLEEIINFAGGILPATSNKTINIKSFDKIKGQRVSKDIPFEMLADTIPSNGDIIEFSSLYAGSDNFVSLKGHVKHPGIFEYKKDMQLSDILPNKNEIQDETLLHQAVIKRISPIDKQLKTIPVSLEDFFEGGNNPYLEPKDIITVYKSTNADFIETYGCINRPKSIPYTTNLTLKDVLTDIQFIASVKEIQVHEEPVNLKIDKDSKKQEKVTLPLVTSNNNLAIPADKVAVEITNSNDAKAFKIYYLLDILVKNDATSNIRINRGDRILFRTLRDNEVLKTVKISGYVNQPGVYTFIEGKRLTDIIETAGGLKEDANLKGITFRREAIVSNLIKISKKKNKKDLELMQGKMLQDTNLTTADIQSQKALVESVNRETKDPDFDGRIVLNIKSNDIEKLKDSANIPLQDGDEIHIPKIPSYVSVIGEVYNESTFIYKPKKKASYYIDLVGGYTPNAKKNKIYKISADGKAYKLGKLSSIEPGDTIIVPRKLKGSDWLNTVMKSMQVVASTLASVFILTEI